MRNDGLAALLILLTITSHSVLATEEWVESFYATADAAERRGIVESLDLSQISFSELYELLATPPPKSQDAPTGMIETFRIGDKREKFFYGLNIPANYDANRAYPLVVFLHGTVGRKKPKQRQAAWRHHEQLDDDSYIQLYPTAWDEAKWWSDIQTENMNDIIARVKAVYNIDTNKVFMSGISDGGTGSYYMAATQPSQFAGFAPVIGFPGALKSRRAKPSENVFPINMRGVKIIAFNSKNDYLYAPDKVKVYTDGFRDIGVDIELVAYPDGNHNMEAFFRSMPRIREFIATTNRESYPDKIIWQYEDGGNAHRVNWLIIHELVPEESSATNLLPGLLRSRHHSGLIELQKTENTVIIQTYGVSSYSLLLSPDHFDFDQPITLIENGKTIHQALLQPDKKTLLKYAVRDFDPKRLYAAEVLIK